MAISLVFASRRQQQANRPPDRLGSGIAEEPLGSPVPVRNTSVQILPHNRVVG